MLEELRRIPALWRELGSEHRRWIYLNALLVTAFINVLTNAAFAGLSVIGRHRVPLWSAPLVGGPCTVLDTVGTFFVLPLVTTLICTTAIWFEISRGRLPHLAAVLDGESESPVSRLRRGARLGVLCLVVLGPLAVVVLVAIDFANLSPMQFVLYKAALGVALGAVVTPVIAILAMADRRVASVTPAYVGVTDSTAAL